MRLYVMRHGDAEPGINDPSRSLSKEGREEARTAGLFLSRQKAKIDIVLHSPLLRAVQTAEIASNEMGSRESIEVTNALPSSDPEGFMRELTSLKLGVDARVLLVTHQPFAGRLVSYMLTRGEGAEMKFTTGAVSCLEGTMTSGTWSMLMHMQSKMMARTL